MKYPLAALALALLVACSGNEELPDIAADAGEQQMYQEAQRHLNNRNFDLAVRALQMLESRYPFGKHAEQAQLELIYAHYGAYEHEAAVEAADRFIRLHPQHPNVDYAYYMKGLAAYTGNEDVFARFLPTDITKRDTSNAKEAFAEFAQLVSRFPDSPYAADAKSRMVYLRNLLARHEINVANYYFRRGAYLAATNRGRYVVENFQRTPAVADGLAVMAQGYLILGMNDLANDAIDTLAMNYPDHPALNEQGEFDTVYTADGLQRSWVNKATFGLFDPPQPPQFDTRPMKF
ncbi:MAG: outer membrane protein assembly factor BamD [Halieaceae bacterium]|nr:outer membrane protein assembly factor BamD [Halieaceae bacterium]